MGEEVVVKYPLTQEMKDAGAELVKRLDAMSLDLTAAFWLFVVDASEWRLIVSLPSAEKGGTRAAYAAVQQALTEDPQLEAVSLRNVTVLGPRDDLVVRLSRGVQTPLDRPILEECWISRCVINGVTVEDAYLYRVWPSRKKARRAARSSRLPAKPSAQ